MRNKQTKGNTNNVKRVGQYVALTGAAALSATAVLANNQKAQADELITDASLTTQAMVNTTDSETLVLGQDNKDKLTVNNNQVNDNSGVQVSVPQAEQEGNISVGDANWKFQGLGNAQFMTMDYYNLNQSNYAPGTLTINAKTNDAHAYFEGKKYAQVAAYRNNETLFDHEIYGKQPANYTEQVQLQPGDLIKVYHAEAASRLVANDVAMKQSAVDNLKDFYYQVSENFALQNISDYIYLDQKINGLFNNQDLAFGVSQANVDTMQETLNATKEQLSSNQFNQLNSKLALANKMVQTTQGNITLGEVFKKDFFVLPATTINQTKQEGRSMGTSHDRQALGLILEKGATMKVRQVNPALKAVTLSLMGDDRQTSAAITVGIDWVDVTAAGDVAAFIKTPVGGAKPQLEYQVVSGVAKELPVFTANTDQQAVLNQWNDSKAQFALIEANNIELLVPFVDIKAVQAIDVNELIDRYDNQVFKLFDDMTGIPTNTEFEAPVKGRYFASADKHGAGAAYYSADHTAQNAASMASYLGFNWLPLHEIAHGYEIPSKSMYIVDTFNNLYGTLYQMQYNENFLQSSWIFGGNKQNAVQATVDMLNAGTSWEQMGYRERLITLFELANNLVGSDALKQFNIYHRQLANQKDANANDLGRVWTEVYANNFKLNVAPFFRALQIPMDENVEQEVYNQLPAVAFLSQVVKADQMPSVLQKLGYDQDMMRSQASLVTNAQLAKAGLSSQIKLHLTNPELVLNKQVSLMDGTKVVKTMTVTGADVDFGNVANGVYTFKISDASLGFTDMYLFVKEDATVVETVRNAWLSQAVLGLFADDNTVKSDVHQADLDHAQSIVNGMTNADAKAVNQGLIDMAQAKLQQFTPNGFGGDFINFRYVNNDGQLRIETLAHVPHSLRANNGPVDYMTVKVTDKDGNVSYQRTIDAGENLQAAQMVVALNAGDEVQISSLDGFKTTPTQIKPAVKNTVIFYVNQDLTLGLQKPVIVETPVVEEGTAPEAEETATPEVEETPASEETTTPEVEETPAEEEIATQEEVETPAEEETTTPEVTETPAEEGTTETEVEETPVEEETTTQEEVETPAEEETATPEVEETPTEEETTTPEVVETPAEEGTTETEVEETPVEEETAEPEEVETPATEETTETEVEETPAEEETTETEVEETPATEETTETEVEETPAAEETTTPEEVETPAEEETTTPEAVETPASEEGTETEAEATASNIDNDKDSVNETNVVNDAVNVVNSELEFDNSEVAKMPTELSVETRKDLLKDEANVDKAANDNQVMLADLNQVSANAGIEMQDSQVFADTPAMLGLDTTVNEAKSVVPQMVVTLPQVSNRTRQAHDDVKKHYVNDKSDNAKVNSQNKVAVVVTGIAAVLGGLGFSLVKKLK